MSALYTISSESPPESAEQTSVNLILASSIIESIDKALTNRNLPEAENLILKLSIVDPAPITFLKLGHVLFLQKKYMRAEKIYKDLLPKVSEALKPEVLFGLGQNYFEAKMFSDSHMAFTILTSSFPEYKYNLFIYLKLARIMINFEDLTNAITYLMKILDSAANKELHAEAMVCLGYIKGKQGKRHESLTQFSRALQTSKSFRTLSAMTFSLVDTKPESVNRACKKILGRSHKPSDWSDFCFIQALANLKMRNLDKAIILLEDQTTSFPVNYFYSEFLGIAYLKNGEKLKALEIFQRLRILFPFDRCNMMNLAFTYRNIGMKKEAFHLLAVVSSLANEENLAIDSLEISEPYMDVMNFPTNNC